MKKSPSYLGNLAYEYVIVIVNLLLVILAVGMIALIGIFSIKNAVPTPPKQDNINSTIVAVTLPTSVPNTTPQKITEVNGIQAVTETPDQVPTQEALSPKELWDMNHEEERVSYLAQQGPAVTIPALEYHGDEYYMEISDIIDYILTPEAFERQMKWFRDNQVHAVTGDELIKWLDGEIELPRKSVVLTFDFVGETKAHSLPRMVNVLNKYGMHGILAIMSLNMDEDQSERCAEDFCWQVIRDAYQTGTVTIASHSIYHVPSANLSEGNGLAEFSNSKKLLEDRIGNGLVVNILSWPYENIPEWKDKVYYIGYELAFGGSTYQINDNAIHLSRPWDRYNLPRVFPPNSNGLSIRPWGETMEKIMEMYWNSED